MAVAVTNDPTDDWEFTFGERLRKARRKMRWSQDQMADAIKVNRPTYASWESGKAFPRGRAFYSVCTAVHEATGAPLDWLLATHGFPETAPLVGLPSHPHAKLTARKTPLVAALDGGRV